MAFMFTLNNGTVVNSYETGDNYNSQWQLIKNTFDDVKLEHTVISDTYIHEYLNEKVIQTCVARKSYIQYLNNNFVSASRLFALESKKQFLFINGGHWQDNPSWCHSDAIILSVSTHIKEDGVAYLEKADDYKKYVIKTNSTISKQEFGIELKDDSDEMIYAIVEGNTLKAVRKLEPMTGTKDELLSNWEGLYCFYTKKEDKKEYIKKLFQSGL